MTARPAPAGDWHLAPRHRKAPETMHAPTLPRENRVDKDWVELPSGRPAPRWLRPLLRRLPGKHIELGSEPYLTRWMLKGDGSGRSWEIYIHHLHAIDVSRFLHNHPWRWFLAFVLAGGYGQDTVDNRIGRVRRERINWFNLFIGQNRYHAIREISDGGVWTLVVSSRRNGHLWGYWDSDRQTHLPDDEDPEAKTSSVTIYFDRNLRVRRRQPAAPPASH
ncbi:MAG: hypothetical protein J4F97_00205 [Pseudomonadales bacterium]|nr:hypothetical protein [Pseudomonadales bacterium]